jgi:hypothetical protein
MYVYILKQDGKIVFEFVNSDDLKKNSLCNIKMNSSQLTDRLP